ncbi:MAG: hypothetical protein Q7T16_06215 [Candidatus Burarchaeum sp.]|nr:hypothetical protein [Candidatus Burarchaeum sp.]MDO8340223.1 hypothetical protein [Candidatus Burarchaeum sp.]
MHKRAAPILSRQPGLLEVFSALKTEIHYERGRHPITESFVKAFEVMNGHRTASDLWGRIAYRRIDPETKYGNAVVEHIAALVILEQSVADGALRSKALQSLRELLGDEGARTAMNDRRLHYMHEFSAGTPSRVSESIWNLLQDSEHPSRHLIYDRMRNTMKLINLQLALGDLVSVIYSDAYAKPYYASAQEYCHSLLGASDAILTKAGLSRDRISYLAEELTTKTRQN